MDAIIINKKGGGNYPLLSYTDSFAVVSAEQQQELMGQDVLNINVKSAVKIDFNIGDFVEIFGERYNLNALPTLDKINDRDFDYTLVFEGARYNLTKAQFLNVDLSGFSSGTDFSLMGDLEVFANQIILNMNRVFGAGSWEVGTIAPNTTTQLITFSGQNCLLTLQDLCTTYSQEFYIERTGILTYKLHIYTNDVTMPNTFKYGRGKGLYNLSRKNIDSKNIITRLYGFGSTKNIPANYRSGSKRLMLPQSVVPSDSTPYIQLNNVIGLYGIIEGSQIFEDIFPQRSGVVSSIFTDQNKFSDASMPFDLFEIANGTTTYILPDTKAKISFKSGNLAGYEFEVSNYDHNNKTFTLLPYTDDRGTTFPSATEAAFKIQYGDTYTILNINLPQSYVDVAESKLNAAAEKYLRENSTPNVQYSLTLDRFYSVEFKCGEYASIQDDDLGLDQAIQIVSFTRDLIDVNKYTIQLGEKRINRLLDLMKYAKGINNKLELNNINGNSINPVQNSNVTVNNNLQYAGISW